MKITPNHHALLCYAEWCADNRRQWPPMKRIAADFGRNLADLHRAFDDLQAWGLLTTRNAGQGLKRIVRLGDGRETLPPISTDILPTNSGQRVVYSRCDKVTRIAA